MVLKKIRSIHWFNYIIRASVKSFYRFSQKAFAFFSLHWPVYGIISFGLPGEEKVKIYSEGDDFVSTQAFWKGYTGYEGPSVKLFYYLSKGSSVIFDMGANVGYFTLIAAAANKGAMVYSFEPIPYIFKRLERNIKLNEFTNVVAVNSAVGNLNGAISFYAPDLEGICHAGSTKKGWASGTTEIKVPSVTADSFKAEKKLPKIDVIKMDCEFHEVEILNGMAVTLADDKPVILMEVLLPGREEVGDYKDNSYIEIEKIMKQWNYYFYLVSETGLIRVDKLEYNPDQRNYLFSAKRSENVFLPYSDMQKVMAVLL